MRRTALQFSLPVLCGLLLIVLSDPVGKAAEPRPQRSSSSSSAAARDVSFLPPLLISTAPARPTMRDLRAAQRRVIMMEVTAYCPCKKCCGPGAQGLTASGRGVNHNNGLFVAADTRLLPFYTKLKIPGYASDRPVQVLDRGGAIKGNRLDVFFPTHKQARAWGRQNIAVEIVD
jgi:3D (Asp-Asp-Asp) domain-containing protein